MARFAARTTMNAPTTMIDEVDAVRQQPVAQQPRIPPRLADAEPVERQRDARERRDAVRQHVSARDQLLRARVDGGAILGADDVERVEQRDG